MPKTKARRQPAKPAAPPPVKLFTLTPPPPPPRPGVAMTRLFVINVL